MSGNPKTVSGEQPDSCHFQDFLQIFQEKGLSLSSAGDPRGHPTDSLIPSVVPA